MAFDAAHCPPLAGAGTGRTAGIVGAGLADCGGVDGGRAGHGAVASHLALVVTVGACQVGANRPGPIHQPLSAHNGSLVAAEGCGVLAKKGTWRSHDIARCWV